MFYRLAPMLDDRSKGYVNMFNLRDLLGSEGVLIHGPCWGKDYLKAPEREEDQQALETLMNEHGVFFEKVSNLPAGMSI